MDTIKSMIMINLDSCKDFYYDLCNNSLLAKETIWPKSINVDIFKCTFFIELLLHYIYVTLFEWICFSIWFTISNFFYIATCDGTTRQQCHFAHICTVYVTSLVTSGRSF